jgi:pimeloyl-ACP methyl ester carboxylesterase
LRLALEAIFSPIKVFLAYWKLLPKPLSWEEITMVGQSWKLFSLVLLLWVWLLPQPVLAQDFTPLSISLEGYPYPYPVAFLNLYQEGQDLRMAYMDVKPEGQGNGKTVVFLHGKNFPASYWRNTISFLTRHGFRVVAPDQIGFGKSSKADLHYSFHQLADNTKKLLEHLGIEKAVIVGHSMGGMLATRFALMYPETTTHLVLVDPIGLEDYRLLVPWISLAQAYKNEFKATPESLRKFYKNYFVKWRPEYGKYAEIAVRQRLSGDYPLLALVSALTYQMIYEQPVCYEFPHVKAKTLVIVGQGDRTVVGKARVPKELLPKVGQYPELGQKTAKAIRGAKLVEIPHAGHLPQFEAPEKFQQALLGFLQ